MYSLYVELYTQCNVTARQTVQAATSANSTFCAVYSLYVQLYTQYNVTASPSV